MDTDRFETFYDAILAIVVVLPTPVVPTKNTTLGPSFAGSIHSGLPNRKIIR